MEQAGFQKNGNGNTYTNESICLSDLHDENVIKTPQGNLVVIDVDARLNTPDLGKGGTYQTNNSLVESSQEKLESSDKNLQNNDDKTHTPLKPQYRGKLIFAETGTGKTSIADNIDVIDSDTILA